MLQRASTTLPFGSQKVKMSNTRNMRVASAALRTNAFLLIILSLTVFCNLFSFNVRFDEGSFALVRLEHRIGHPCCDNNGSHPNLTISTQMQRRVRRTNSDTLSSEAPPERKGKKTTHSIVETLPATIGEAHDSKRSLHTRKERIDSRTGTKESDAEKSITRIQKSKNERTRSNDGSVSKHAQNDTASSLLRNVSSRLEVHGCLGPLYGSINWNAVTAWVEYYQRRWGLTHVDIFVEESQFNVAEETFLNASVETPRVALNFTLIPNNKNETGMNLYKYQHWLVGECLANAKRLKHDYLLQFDADEYLISSSFPTLNDMFEFANKNAVAFPMFQTNYFRCSSNEPTFGSANYHPIVPHGSQRLNDTVNVYTDPPIGCKGQRKYIVRPQYFEKELSIHDPIDCSGNSTVTYYMTGRKSDGEHARLIHFRTGRGLHADEGYEICDGVRSCKYLNEHGSCIDEVGRAYFAKGLTSVNKILADWPLHGVLGDKRFQKDAVCFAKRYPDLLQRFCDNDASNCRYSALRKHFKNHDNTTTFTWGCDQDN